jgi:hypothetical protein
MPGDNCAFNQCGTSWRTKGIRLFKLPTAKDEESHKWRRDFFNITKYHVKDNDFNKQLAADSLHVCEKHFLPKEIQICKYCNSILNYILRHGLDFYNRTVVSGHIQAFYIY